MYRKNKIVVLAHCLLNVNSKVSGLALYEGVHRKLVLPYIEAGAGIIQLPCPEMSFIGPLRWGMSKNQYDTISYRNHCREILTPVVEQMQEYSKNGCVIETIVGVDGSPSCGINYYSNGYSGGMVEQIQEQKNMLHEAPGQGVFMEEFSKLLAEKGLRIGFQAISEKEQL